MAGKDQWGQETWVIVSALLSTFILFSLIETGLVLVFSKLFSSRNLFFHMEANILNRCKWYF